MGQGKIKMEPAFAYKCEEMQPAANLISGTASLRNGLSIDVEDYFQVWAFSDVSHREIWHTFESRIEVSTERALRLFDDANVHATFFTLGWIAERHPALVRKIVACGHEVASHGYWHEKVTNQNARQFREDVCRAKQLLEDITGEQVTGYRAPSFSVNSTNLWAFDVLSDAGYLYSSSTYPVSHDHYGMPESPRFAYRPGALDILEVPMSTAHVMGRNMPCSGGGYFRLLPYSYFRWAIRRMNDEENEPAIFYFHPWEIDLEQPRLSGISLKSRFRHFVNISKMESRIKKLLADFSWDRMDNVFLRCDR